MEKIRTIRTVIRMNKDNENKSYGGGIGFAGVLTAVFIALKLAGIIDWSWIWVLSPLWIKWALIAVLAVILAIITVFKKKRKW